MSIQSEITRINNNISSAYSAIDAKGGTLPQTQNSANLASSIQSISGGGSSLPTDPSTDGDYVLQNTVSTDATTSEQTAELSWEKKLSAGSGIEIDENNEINTVAELPIYSDLLMGTSSQVATGYDWYTPFNKQLPRINLTEDALIEQLKKNGRALFYNPFGTSITYSSLYNIGIRYLLVGANYSDSASVDITIGNSTNTVVITPRYPYFVIIGTYLLVFPYCNIYNQWLGYHLPFYQPTTSITSKTLSGAVRELETTRLADSLSSTETTPSTDNTIIWQYE